jgi:hypothetical protein
MPDKNPETPKDRSGLTRDIQNFVRRRTDKKEVKASGVRKHTEIQLLLSELDNLLMNMSHSDPRVATAKDKLLELKELIDKTLDIK